MKTAETDIKLRVEWTGERSRPKFAVFTNRKAALSLFEEKLVEGKLPRLYEIRTTTTTTQIA